MMYILALSFYYLNFNLVNADLPSKLFDLPSLTVSVEQPYLVRKHKTILVCELSAGWSGAKLHNIRWLKDGEPIENLRNFAEDLNYFNETLTISNAKAVSEGEYQCLADVVNIALSNKQLVDTRLVSSPVIIRRARITKFDNITEHMVSVVQGEVARLPCIGIPDVIPGPPQICFEKENTETPCFSDDSDKALSNSSFLFTNTGMQITLVQPAHSGSYYCVVRNEFTRQFRRSPKPVILLVLPSENPSQQNSLSSEVVLPSPELVFPQKSTKDKPIIVDAVLGRNVLLECVFTNSKVIWIKDEDTTPQISLNDENARIQQISGNLRFRNVRKEDGGNYSCHGVSPFEAEPSLLEGSHPKVYYKLVVHQPTSVRLTLTENPVDKSWQLSCLARNLFYEIPMAFVNGTALIDAIHEMGVPSSTNFFTNPINATIKVKQTFSGSVQCISRPAMDEAEIYGQGMDRGISQNKFVSSSLSSKSDMIKQGPQNVTVVVGSTVTLPCIVQNVHSRYWSKDNKTIRTYSRETRIAVPQGTNSLQIRDVRLTDEGWYTCNVKRGSLTDKANAFLTVLAHTSSIVQTTTEPFELEKKNVNISLDGIRGFVTGTDVRIQWSVLGTTEAITKIANFRIELQRNGSTDNNWLEVDMVDSHVRATTIKELIPNETYRLRVVLHRDDGTTLTSNSTDWMTVNKPVGDILPAIPQIVSLSLVSSSSVRIEWNHSVPIENARARHFLVFHTPENEEKSEVVKVDGNLTEAEIDNLTTGMTYSFQLLAENHAGKSGMSASESLNITDSSMGFISFLKETMTLSVQHTIILSLAAFFIVLLMLLICCVVYGNVRTKNRKKANGKFLDTSYRIFNEQKVHKSRIVQNDNFFVTEDFPETSPAEMDTDERKSINSEKFNFHVDGGSAVPNLYGNINECLEEQQKLIPISEQTYVSASKIIGSGIYGPTPTARCYSPDSGTSHEMVIPYGNNMNTSTFNSSSQMSCYPQRVSAYKAGDSFLYSPVASSTADTSSSGVHIPRNPCDSPTNPLTDGSDQGIRCGGSSRNSQISSSDGRAVTMQTFKSTSPNTTSFLSGTFERKKEPQNESFA